MQRGACLGSDLGNNPESNPAMPVVVKTPPAPTVYARQPVARPANGW